MKTKDNIGVIILLTSATYFIVTDEWFREAGICICMGERRNLSNL
ncbi:MAG TPA: hypothetical protein PL097_09565 [Dysgonamonadaceae bacterium]|nr:hypothetical protein [Dysgonamonadaceae bacterium]HOT65418.1 hypothetical protein [Dysgonamonadaceae bacterium]HPD44305.1 hypothetical protein [Dysgonamonadaceae bacterium]HQG08426.1 hypothetical protein [Dysgonamonadaceae bacterium]HQI43595.1 hypothetical protein [Dysgonamonadaceae bacterium]